MKANMLHYSLVKSATLLVAMATCASFGGEVKTDRRMVWAHYVPWHTPDNDSLTPLWYVNHTVSDVGANSYRDEIRRATAQGVDGFFMDVCVRRGHSTFSDIRPFLKAAEGTDFQCAVCLDCKTDVSNQVAELKKTLSLNATHPNYPRVDGKPVVATYTWHDWTPDEWRRIREGMDAAGMPVWLLANLGLGQKTSSEKLLDEYAKVFDAGYYFGYGVRGPSKDRKNEIAADICARHGRLFMPAVAPGYYGGWVHGRNDFYTPFRGLDAIQGGFEAARRTSGANWLHLTTWNDYDETALLPCRLSPGCLPLVRAYANAWKDLPQPERADIIFTYHREEFPGTVIRFEAMRLPSADASPVEVAGRLRDKDGHVVATLAKKSLGAAWERAEWLVGSSDLAASPVLVPEFAMRDGNGTRRTKMPAMFLVRGWLEAPETIRAAFEDCADVKGDLSMSYANGLLSARMSFSGEAPVKRAILYRNDRPLAQFAPDDGCRAQISLYAHGAGTWTVAARGGEVAEIVRASCPKGAKLRLDGSSASSVQTPAWARCAVRAVGGKDMRLAFSANKARREASPAELARLRRIAVGGVTFEMAPDMTLYQRTPWNASAGKAQLALFERAPQPADAFWVRFETVDGRAAATTPIWPFAPEATVEEAVLVETPVTLESPSGPDRKPDSAEFRTPFAEWPVKTTRLVKKPASALSVRRAFWPLGGRDGADDLAEGVNAIGDRAIVGGKLPLRMWPTGPSTIAFDVLHRPAGAKKRTLFRRTGWMDSVSAISLTEDGRIEAAYGEHNTLLAIAGRTPLKADRWTRIAVSFDGVTLQILQDGKEDGSGSLPAPIRCYGNCTAYVGPGVVNVEISGKETR